MTDSPDLHVAQLSLGGALSGLFVSTVTGWLGFVALGALGGIVGHLIWVERYPQKAAAMPISGHLKKVFRNMVVSGFLGVLIFFTVWYLNMERSPISYMITGVAGMASIDFALLFIGMLKNAVRGWAKQVIGSDQAEGDK